MQSKLNLFDAILLIILVNSEIIIAIKLRVITWNVLENSKMKNGFTDEAIDYVLGLNEPDDNRPNIYAIGLQENCWMCNKGNLHNIAQVFKRRINRKLLKKYDVFGLSGTRLSHFCQAGCKLNTHGTTLLIIIGQISFAPKLTSFRQIKSCSSKFPPNDEKGIAAIKVSLEGLDKVICFATAHLDSKKSSSRRKCLQKFFERGNKQDVNWSSTCDAQFIFGDLNTRTGKKTKGESKGRYVSNTTDLTMLKERDELRGVNPYGTDSDWKSNLLTYINKIQDKTFGEGSVNYMPTYSIKPADEFCDGKFPCYRTNRPLSWTDRVLYTSGTLLKYDAVYKEYSDHFPVYAEFILE